MPAVQYLCPKTLQHTTTVTTRLTIIPRPNHFKGAPHSMLGHFAARTERVTGVKDFDPHFQSPYATYVPRYYTHVCTEKAITILKTF